MIAKLIAMLKRLFNAVRPRTKRGPDSIVQVSAWALDADAPYSQSAQPVSPHIAAAPPTVAQPNPSGPPIVNAVQSLEEFEKEQHDALWRPINKWFGIIGQDVENHLQHVHVAPLVDHDEIFGAHTAFVKFAVENAVPNLPIMFWEQKVKPLVESAETELKKSNPNARIHKGAPLFNIGVCNFAAGDLENGFKYLAQAGKEDELSGRGSRFPVLIGDHPLSKQFLIRPIVVNLVPAWVADYHAITQIVLDENELVSLIKQAALRPTDGIQLVVALHRLLKSKQPPENDWTRFLRTRALADALVALESMLRRIHQAIGIQSEMHDQMVALLQVNLSAKNEFESFHRWFKVNWQQKNLHKSAAAVNACVSEAIRRVAVAATPSAKAGIACYIAVRLRNSLLHVLEDSLDIYADEPKCITMIGYTLAVFRIAKHGEDGTFAGLP